MDEQANVLWSMKQTRLKVKYCMIPLPDILEKTNYKERQQPLATRVIGWGKQLTTKE